MNRNHIEVWRDYLVGQMQERSGVAEQQAQKAVAKWLNSLGKGLPKSEVRQIPAARIRNQRFPSIKAVHARPSARRTRAAHG
jgi:hypothetical protein